MPHVMSVGALTKSMGTLARIAKPENGCSAARAPKMLSDEGLLLGTNGEFAEPLGHLAPLHFVSWHTIPQSNIAQLGVG